MKNWQLLIVLTLIIVTPSCELFYSSIFPEYLGNLLSERNYESEISSQFSDLVNSSPRYQFFSVEVDRTNEAGEVTRQTEVYLLVSPTLNISNVAGTRGRLFHISEEGVLQGVVNIPEGSDFTLRSSFGTPFLLSNSSPGTDTALVIAGNVSIDVRTSEHVVYGTVNHQFSSGYGLIINAGSDAVPPGTYLFSGPTDSNYFTLRMVAFTNSPPSTPEDDWTVIGNRDSRANAINIDASSQESREASGNEGGYTLTGIIPNEGERQAIFLFESESDNNLLLRIITYQQIYNYYRGMETRDITALSTANISSEVSIDIGNTKARYYTNNEIIVHRENGRMLRYNLQGELQDSIKAESRDGILLYFSSNGEYLYRFDPATFRIQVFNTWW